LKRPSVALHILIIYVLLLNSTGKALDRLGIQYLSYQPEWLLIHTHSYSHKGGHTHSHEGGHRDSHAHEGHGHSHEILGGPGSFLGREMPLVQGRNWEDRAFTVGVGGYASLFLSLRGVLTFCSYVFVFKVKRKYIGTHDSIYNTGNTSNIDQSVRARRH
jgi:hypothetical protein